MKKVNVLFIILLLGVCVSSCSNDDNDDPKFNVAFLKQTGWTGTLEVIVDGEVSYKYDKITYYFTTDSRGDFTIGNGGIFSSGEFGYTLDDKLMRIIVTRAEDIAGDWILLGIKKNKLSFRKGITNAKNYHTLNLTRLAY